MMAAAQSCVTLSASPSLGSQGLDAPHCALEVHPGDVVQYSRQHLEHVCSTQASQPEADNLQTLEAVQTPADQVRRCQPMVT